MATANPFAEENLQPRAANDSRVAVNPFSEEALQASEKTVLRGSLLSGQSANPDQTAEAVKLSRKTGAPYEAIQANLPEVQQGARLDDYEKMLAGAPATRKFLTAPQNAAMANDDVGNLTAFEEAFAKALGAGRAAYGRVGETYRRPSGQLRANERSIAGAFSEPVQRGLAQGDRGLTFLLSEMGVLSNNPAGIGVRLANQQREIERFPVPQDIEQGMTAISSAPTMGDAAEAILGNPRAVFEVSLQSLGASAPSLIGAVAGSVLGPGGTAAGAGLGSFAVEYAATLQEVMAEKGVNGRDPLAITGALGNPDMMSAAREKAIKRGIPIAIFDALTAGVAGRLLAGSKGTIVSATTRAVGELAVQAGGGAAGEAIAQAVTGEYKPGDILLEALAEMPSAMVEVPANIRSARARASQAEQSAAAAENLAKVAEAVKLRARDPESFAQFVNQVAESSGDAPAEFYISSDTLTNTLNQAGITMERLAMVAPAVAAQLRAASFVPGADIRVPVAEFAAAGADITIPLIDHLRETPDAMSRAEAQEYLKTEGDRIQGDVEKELGKMNSSIAARQDLDKATARFEAELTSAGRFRPEVNKAYAGMMGNFYATQAARAGMPLEDFLQKYQLRVTGKTGQGAQTLEQSVSDDPQRWATYTADRAKAPGEVIFSSDEFQIEFKPVAKDNPDGMEAFQAVGPDGSVIGTLDIGKDGERYKGAIQVAPANRRQGIASALYREAEKKLGVKLTPDTPHTADAAAFWAQPNRQFGEPNQSPAQAGRAQAATNSIATTVERAQAAVADFLGSDTLPNGLGKVVVTTAADIKATWEPLIGRNVQMESEGDAGAAQAFYDPASKTVFLIADNIRAGDEAAVLAHELMHKHGQAALGKAGWDKLHSVINTWANSPEDSDERAVYQYASSKVRAVGEQLSSQEMFPYAVEAALKMGVQPSKKAKAGTVSRWLNDVQTAMKTAWDKVTGKPEAFDTQDLVNLAYGIAQMENPALAISQQGQAAINPVAVAQQSADPETGLPQFAGSNGLFIGFAAPTERLEFIPTDDSLQMLNFVIMRDGQMIGSADLLFEGDKLVSLYDIEVDKAGRGKGDGAAVIQTLLGADPLRDVEISNIVESARGFWESVGVPTQNLGPGEAYDGTLNWQTYTDSRAGQRAARGNDDGSTGTVRGADTSAAGPGQSGDGQADNRLNQSAVDQTATPAFLKWFGDSKVVDDAGKPLVVYHGTTAEFSEFKTETEMGAHFGTAPQANSMAISSGNVMPSFLSLKNPLRMRDRGDFSPGMTVEQLADLGVKPKDGSGFPSFAQLDAMTVADATKQLQAIIEANGYDGIVYLNRREGLGTTANDPEPSALEFDDFTDAQFKQTFPGAADSYIAFRPEQIKSAIGNNGDFNPANPNILNQPAFHGSPHDFERFSTDNIGSGEGAQAYGWGLYFAENKGIAEGYHKSLSLKVAHVNGEVPERGTLRWEAANMIASKGYDAALDQATKSAEFKFLTPAGREQAAKVRDEIVALKDAEVKDKSSGGVYEVDIPDEAVANMLLWDKPLSEQPEAVQKALATIDPDQWDVSGDDYDPNQTGQWAYMALAAGNSKRFGSMKIASQTLAKAGVPGIKYLDGGSRAGGDGNYNLVVFDDSIVKLTHKDGSPVTTAERNEYLQSAQSGNQAPRATLNFASDITQAPSVIALLEGADLSSFLHESGHFFLEVQADLAARIQLRMSFGDTVSEAERGIVDDMNTLLAWFGVTDMPEASALDQWALKTLEERREAHETFARGFERYAMEGKAPTQELAGLFNKFRSWLISVYQKLASLNVNLTDDVRAVMDRMLASDEAIAEAQAARNMGPLFQSPEQAGMTPAEYDTYQFLGERATAAASEELDARLMKDMKWLSRAKSKAIKAAQEEAAQLRRDTEIEVRREVMAQPIYQAWQILTGKGLTAEDRLAANKKRGKSNTLNPAVDNLFEAIANLGGLDKAQVQAAWGVEDKLESGLFGKPVLRVEGGRSIEGMIERLVEEGYILPGRNGMTDAEQFEALFDDQRRGVDRYSVEKEFSASQEDAPIEGVDLTNRFAKLNTTELQRRYGMKDDAVWRILSERRMTNDTGLDPDLLAESIPGGGFTSGDELVRKLAAAPPPAQVIAEQTDQRMMERYGDITSAEALSQAADEAVHNELRARVIATELKALQKAGQVLTGDRNTTSVLAKAAKEYAAQVIARQRVRDLRPSQYTAAEGRSAKLAEQALGKDMAEAALHKRNQLINNYAARAAYDAQDEVKAMQAYFRKFDKRRDSIDPGYQDQIEALLERFDFKPASLKAIDKRKSFAAWYEEAAAGDNPPDVPEYLLDEASRKSYKDMTVEELRGLRDTVKQIEHQGRLKNKLLLARDQRDFDAAATAMANSIVENGGEAREVNLEGPNPVTDWFAGVAASHRKLASLFRQMDGNKDDGPMYDLIGRGMNERGTMEDVMVEKATVALRDIYAPLMKMRGGITGARSKLYIPEIDASLTRGGRLAVALNWGNEANRQRIMDGDKWSAGQVQAILKTLTPVELKFVNDVWAYIDSYWEDIAAKEKRLTGVAPEKVQAQPFAQMAADGTEVQMRGGYYPLKYDTDRSDRADTQEAAQAAKEMMQGVMTRSTTRRGHTKERLKEVKRAVRKDLNVITQHITQVTHDLAWHEWLIDTNKLLQDNRVVSAIRDHYGPKVLKTIRDDVMGIATADVVPQTDIDKALLTLRGNVTRATMGASITTAFLQPFGLTQSMVRIGPQHVLRGMARWGGDAVRMENTVEWIRDKSEFMRLRSKTFNKELREIRGSVAGKSATMRVVDAGLFALMQKMQLVADVPTWIGQYEKSTAEGLDEAAAVAMADRAVLESQGGGATKDLAEVQRKHPMLTQFYSYFSVTLNLAAEQTAATDFKNPAAVAGWLGDMALLMVIPAILPSFIMFALKGGDEDDEKGWAKRIAEWQLGYLMGTIVGVRELSGAVSGFDYAGPPVGRIIADLGKAGKQTAQGELDEPAVMAYIKLMGTAFGIPITQALRSYKGWKAWDEGQEGAGPQSVLFGPPPRD